MAIVAEGTRGRFYESPTTSHERTAIEVARDRRAIEARETFLSGSTPTRAMITGGVCSAYGLKTWGHLFTDRQLIALNTFSDLIAEAREKVLADALGARASGPHASETPALRLADGGTGAEAYADAIAMYLAFALSKLADRGSTICTWFTERDSTRPTFARQAIPMSWDFAELNTLLTGTGSFEGAVSWTAESLEAAVNSPSIGAIHAADAASGGFSASKVVVFTDPPYYDNIGYADLSDFFYVWLRRSLKDIWPGLLATVLVPKVEELVATPYRHGGKEAAEQFFLEGMRCALANMAAAAAPDFPVTLYYAFKQSERTGGGTTSTGWDAFLQALVDVGFAVDGTWPMRSELSNRMIASGTNALASSIVHVCQKRPADAPVTTRAAFLRELKRELPAAMELLQAGNIAPVDLAQAAIGPGMAIFSRYAKVLNADDTPMTVKRAHQDINAALDVFLSEQEAEYDAYTRFAITWFEQAGMAAGAYGTAETLATARGVSVAGVREAGIVESGGGKVRLKRREEMEGGGTDTVWSSTQHLIHRLMGEAGCEEAAAEALARLGTRAEAAKDLAYRLYGICERKKWAEEGYAYNALVASWPRLVERAKNFASGPAQGTLGL